MITLSRFLYTIFFCLVISSGITLAQLSTTEKLNEYLSVYKVNKDVPSIAAGVAKDNKIIWLRTEGYSDLENNVPATSRSIYRVASISKCITAVAVMQLVEKGKIDLDEDVRTYLTYFPKKRWKFTVRQLLNHTSGIRGYRRGEFDNKDFFPDTKFTVNFVAKDSLEFEPGTRYLYTTLGYNLLAAIIEKASGRKFMDYLKVNIFEPAEMTSTYADYQSDIVPFRVRGYERNSYREIQNAPLADLSIKFAGGGLISTAEDLLRFSVSLMNEKLISSAAFDTMLVPTKLKNGDRRNYGLGFAFGKDKSGEFFISHAGGGTGFSSLLVLYPESKLASVHLINIRDRNLDEPAFVLADIVMGREYHLPSASFADKLLKISTGLKDWILHLFITTALKQTLLIL
jgi:serine beta-lactamase-like protein LACTB, mitochondrial